MNKDKNYFNMPDHNQDLNTYNPIPASEDAYADPDAESDDLYSDFASYFKGQTLPNGFLIKDSWYKSYGRKNELYWLVVDSDNNEVATVVLGADYIGTSRSYLIKLPDFPKTRILNSLEIGRRSGGHVFHPIRMTFPDNDSINGRSGTFNTRRSTLGRDRIDIFLKDLSNWFAHKPASLERYFEKYKEYLSWFGTFEKYVEWNGLHMFLSGDGDVTNLTTYRPFGDVNFTTDKSTFAFQNLNDVESYVQHMNDCLARRTDWLAS
ncbi:hypothetical protein HAU47_02445 [Weissella confusa]|uniref:DUF6994 family protein n=1 Tax=Weissella confusa TaxID=1583 RepID=UPI0018F23644|nr:hypothetical protein [Weissella confusa]MBJ7619469.1 hypothetical protein [Weissella confusa]MBJ7666804.1 hypothetical protein [Weissella confusa]